MSTSSTRPREAQDHPSEESLRRGHEMRDINPRVVLGLGAAVFLGLLIVQLLLGLMLAGMQSSAARHDSPLWPLAKQSPESLSPRLQSQPQADYERYRHEQETQLNSYGWIDRGRGVVRIPVSRAMDLIAERGLPVLDKPKSGPGSTEENVDQ